MEQQSFNRQSQWNVNPKTRRFFWYTRKEGCISHCKWSRITRLAPKIFCFSILWEGPIRGGGRGIEKETFSYSSSVRFQLSEHPLRIRTGLAILNFQNYRGKIFWKVCQMMEVPVWKIPTISLPANWCCKKAWFKCWVSNPPQNVHTTKVHCDVKIGQKMEIWKAKVIID